MRLLMIMLGAFSLSLCWLSAFVLAPVTSTSDSPTALIGDAERGQLIFTEGVNGSTPCTRCHSIRRESFGFGPSLNGMADRDPSRIAGMSGDAYLYQSIIQPDVFIVAGFRDMMPNDYREYFSEQDLADLIAYLHTL